MKNKTGILSRETWFGEREKIDLSLFSPKELSIFNLKRFCGGLSHSMYFILYTTLAIISYIWITKLPDNSTYERFSKTSIYVFTGVGHISSTLVQYIIGKITRPKPNKYLKKGSQMIVKHSIMGVIFLIIALLPPIIYIIGRIFIYFHYKDNSIKITSENNEIVQDQENDLVTKAQEIIDVFKK